MKNTLLFLLMVAHYISFGQNTKDIKSYIPELSKIYMHLHQHPELSYMEHKTAKLLADKMVLYGYNVTQNFGGTGIVAILKNGKGNKVLIRTDMDALPIFEKTGVSYASKVRQVDIDGIVRPVMHACGHDIHMSVWLGVAKYLAEHTNEWGGTLMMIAQPAEERGGGAKAMLNDGLYTKFFVPDYALALHVHSGLPTGKIAYRSGFSLANVDMLKIKIIGKGGHGAYPQNTIDPIVMASQLVLDLQTIVSREISAHDPAVVTVGLFQGGTKANIIPAEVNLALTIRTYKDGVRDHIIRAIKRKANAIAASYGVPKENYPVFELKDNYTPAVYNNPLLVEKVVNGFNKSFGKDNVLKSPPAMGGEDFSRYGKTDDNVPIFMFALGIVNKEKYDLYKKQGKQLPALHSDKVIPDYEKSIENGIKAMVTAVKSL